jgi:hypothetical protein
MVSHTFVPYDERNNIYLIYLHSIFVGVVVMYIYYHSFYNFLGARYGACACMCICSPVVSRVAARRATTTHAPPATPRTPHDARARTATTCAHPAHKHSAAFLGWAKQNSGTVVTVTGSIASHKRRARLAFRCIP